jgi:hypothetical protein
MAGRQPAQVLPEIPAAASRCTPHFDVPGTIQMNMSSGFHGQAILGELNKTYEYEQNKLGLHS